MSNEETAEEIIENVKDYLNTGSLRKNETTYKEAAEVLLEHGMDEEDVEYWLKRLYQGAAADFGV